MTPPLTFSAITRRGLSIAQAAIRFPPENFSLRINQDMFYLLDDHETAVLESDDVSLFAKQVEAYLTKRLEGNHG